MKNDLPRGTVNAIFPGSFDPLTLGHLDLIKRGARLFEKLAVVILVNPDKKPLLSFDERLCILQYELAEIPGVYLLSYKGLLANLAYELGVKYILRGVRTEADCAYEIPMAQANSKLRDGLETVFLISDPAYAYMSAGLIREIAAAAYKSADGFDDAVLDQWITPAVKEALRNKIGSISS